MATFTDITDRREMLLRNKPECSSCADAGDDTVPATKVIEDTTPDSYYLGTESALCDECFDQLPA